MGTAQSSYYIHCYYCGGKVEVINPRVNQEPEAVGLNLSGSIDSGAIEEVDLACPSCDASLTVIFRYPQVPQAVPASGNVRHLGVPLR